MRRFVLISKSSGMFLQFYQEESDLALFPPVCNWTIMPEKARKFRSKDLIRFIQKNQRFFVRNDVKIGIITPQRKWALDKSSFD
jgi:hypothetical protein